VTLHISRKYRRLRHAAEIARDLTELSRGVAEGNQFSVLVERACTILEHRIPRCEVVYVDYDDSEDDGVPPGAIIEVVTATGRAVGALVASRTRGSARAEEATYVAAVAHVLSAAASRDRQASALEASIRLDPLTGALNRVGLTEVLSRMLDRSRGGRMISVLCLDLDHFGAVNEAYGYATGDAVLRHVTRRLRADAGPHAHVARVEADRFVVVAPAGDHTEISRLAQRLRSTIARPLSVTGTRGHPLCVTACLGYVAALAGADLPDVVLRDAVMTLENARRRGDGSICCVDDDIRRTGETRQFLAEALPPALLRGELTPVYQPIVDAQNGAVEGAEALVRWCHPDRGDISPVDLVSTAERLGIVHLVGEQMLDSACAQLARWRRDGTVSPSFTITINISPTELASPNLVARVAAALKRHNVPPSRLCLEITENAFINDLAACARTATLLRSLGVRIAVDDFGIGYSSLAYLDRLPLDVIKIDRSFVERIGADSGPRAIVAGLVAVAHELRLVVIAEGIEHESQLAAVRELGCHRVQGFLLGRPMTADRFERVLRGDEEPPAASSDHVGAAAG
jgi:diguanylate cyclase (GGDEF)-like protein